MIFTEVSVVTTGEAGMVGCAIQIRSLPSVLRILLAEPVGSGAWRMESHCRVDPSLVRNLPLCNAGMARPSSTPLSTSRVQIVTPSESRRRTE
ncbi:hypothetical protein D3C71_1945390 [compost metagenome]